MLPLEDTHPAVSIKKPLKKRNHQHALEDTHPAVSIKKPLKKRNHHQHGNGHLDTIMKLVQQSKCDFRAAAAAAAAAATAGGAHPEMIEHCSKKMKLQQRCDDVDDTQQPHRILAGNRTRSQPSLLKSKCKKKN